MIAPSIAAPPPEEGLQVYRRLREGDPTAWSDLATLYLPHLVAWLGQINPRLPEEFCVEAAEEAVISLNKNPDSYDPDRKELGDYLRMSAQGDLRNLLRQEGRHHRNRRAWEAVELSPDAGKYLGRDDDPSLPLRLAEEEAALRTSVPDAVRQGLSDVELRVLDLVLHGERKHAAYAAVCGVTDLPRAEQVKAVNRVKNKVKKRLERARGEHA